MAGIIRKALHKCPFLDLVLSSPGRTPTIHQHTNIHLLIFVPMFIMFLFSGITLSHPHPHYGLFLQGSKATSFSQFPLNLPPPLYPMITSSCVFRPILCFTSIIALIKWHYLYLCVSLSCDLLEEGVTSRSSLGSCFLGVCLANSRCTANTNCLKRSD